MSGFGEGEGQLLRLTYPKPLPMRLDRWLVSQRPEQSRARIQKFIDAGYVRVNGVTGRAKTPLRQHDEVQLWMPPPEPLPYLVPQPIPLDVLFEDDHLIVLNKPAGLTVHPAPGNRDGTLVNGLLHHCPDLPGIGGELRPGIVHRLDKDTSGLLLVAKSLPAHTALVRELAERAISRQYLAICNGVLTGGGTIDAPIDRHPVDRTRMAVRDNGRPAVTHFTVIERFRAHTFVNVVLETGRTHQIRVHLAHCGHGLIGDPVYGGKRKLSHKAISDAGVEAALLFPRQALHAATLGFEHPVSGEDLRFEAELPEDMANLVASLRG